MNKARARGEKRDYGRCSLAPPSIHLSHFLLLSISRRPGFLQSTGSALRGSPLSDTAPNATARASRRPAARASLVRTDRWHLGHPLAIATSLSFSLFLSRSEEKRVNGSTTMRETEAIVFRCFADRMELQPPRRSVFNRVGSRRGSIRADDATYFTGFSFSDTARRR